MEKDSSDWFLGIVERDVKDQFTRLHPIRVISADLRWEEIAGDLKTRFPTRGGVSWFHAPLEIRRHTLVEFQAVPNPKFDPAKGPDELQVLEWRVAIELFELEGWSESRLREGLTSVGVPLPHSPTGRCMLKPGAGNWFGPFDLVETKSAHWGLPPSADLEAIPLFDKPPAAATAMHIHGQLYTVLVTAGLELTAPRVANWQLESDVLRSVLRRLHKLDLSRFKELRLTYAAFDAYIDAVAKAELLPAQLAIERARAERLRQMRGDLRLVPELVDELVAELEKFDAVKLRLAERVGELVEERKGEIDAHVTAASGKLEKLQRKISEARAKSAELAKQIGVRKKGLTSDLLAVDEAMREKVRELHPRQRAPWPKCSRPRRCSRRCCTTNGAVARPGRWVRGRSGCSDHEPLRRGAQGALA